MKGLPSKIKRNIAIYYILASTINGVAFVASNWIYFWTRYMTFGRLGLIDALGFGYGLLLEIPSGAIADLLGKKRTILVGFLAGTIGVLMIASANSLSTIFIGWILTQTAFAFYSGAGEALAYDSLKEVGLEEEYGKVIGQKKIIEIISIASFVLIGGFMYEYWFRLPHFAWAISFLVGFIASLFLYEPKVDTEKFSLKIYLNQLRVGTKELFSPMLQKYLIFILLLPGVYFMYSAGFIKSALANSFGFHAKAQSVIFTIIILLSALTIRFYPRIRRRITDLQGLSLLSILMALSFLSASFPIKYWGIFPMLATAIAGSLSEPWISVIVNQEISSKYRATTLSTVSMITRIPYVLAAIVAGNLIQQGNLWLLTSGIGVFIILCLIVASIWRYRPRMQRTNH